MLPLIKKIIKNGIKSEKINSTDNDKNIKIIGTQLKKRIHKIFGRSLTIRLVDAGSCNGCELELHAINNPIYNIERYGIKFVASPRHADVLLVTGPVTKNMKQALIKTFNAIPEPKWVIAIGDCAYCGGVFKGSYAVENGICDLIKVDVIVKGCPPTPLQIMTAILQLIQKYEVH